MSAHNNKSIARNSQQDSPKLAQKQGTFNFVIFISLKISFASEFAFIFKRIIEISQLNVFFRLNFYEDSQFVTLLVTVNLFWNV